MRAYPHRLDATKIATLRQRYEVLVAKSRPKIAEALINENSLTLDIHAEAALVLLQCRYAQEEPRANLIELMAEIAECLEAAFAADAPRDAVTFARDLAVSILAGRKSMQMRLAAASRPHFSNPDVEVDELHFCFAEALAAAVAEDWALCRERLDAGRKRAGARGLDSLTRKWMMPLIEMLDAVVEKDVERMNAAVAGHQAQYAALFAKAKSDPEGLLDVTGLGVLGLAKARGLFLEGKLTSENVYLPVELL